MDSFGRGSFFTCKHFTPVKTSLRIWWSRNTPVTTLRRHLPGPILWHATAHTPARVLEDPLVLLVAADSRGGRPASWRSPKSGVVSQCSAATPYTQTSPGPLAGSGSACLAGSWCQSWNGFNGLPGVHSLLYMRSTTQSLLGPKCLRKEASLLHLTADRQAGRMQEARKPMWCGARLCSPASGGYSVREAEFAVAVLAEENPNGFQWGMVLRMARCGTKRQRR